MTNKKNIIFAGDSFTWGEGLEFYINKEPWISQRKKYSDWPILEKLQTPESIEFREKNRFPSLVSKHFGVTPLVFEKNGGNFKQAVKHIEDCINKDTIAIVFQYTQIYRMYLHLRQDTCKCKYCKWQAENGWIIPLFHCYFDIVNKLSNNEEPSIRYRESLDFLKMVQVNPYYVPTFEEWKSMNIDQRENYVNSFQRDIVPTFDVEFRKQFNDIANFFQSIEKKWKIPIYTIDAWDEKWTRRLIIENPILLSYMISLKAQDNKYYDDWYNWKIHNKNPMVSDDFPETENEHPTLKSHKLIAESIIHKLELDGFTKSI